MELANYLPYLVNRVGQKFVAEFTPTLRAHGIDIQAWRVLSVLMEQDGLPVSAVSDLTSINLSTLSRVLGRMEKGNLVERHQDDADGRSWEVTLTQDGRRIGEELLPAAEALEADALSEFSSDERDALKSYLTRLYDGLETVDASGSASVMESDHSTPHKTITISSRFCGPSDSGHGGYTSGLLAGELGGTAEVTLRRRVPMDKALTVVVEADKALLMDSDNVICEARPASIDLDPIPMPSLEAVAESEQNFCKDHDHFYPHCFVCGPDREPGDGLRIFSGVHSNGGYAAANWTPDEEFADKDGLIKPEIIWAVMDCPAYFGMNMFDRFVLTGRMAVEIFDRPWAGEPYVLAGWRTGEDGRKHYAASALYDTRGTVLARSTSTWIEPKS